MIDLRTDQKLLTCLREAKFSLGTGLSRYGLVLTDKEQEKVRQILIMLEELERALDL